MSSKYKPKILSILILLSLAVFTFFAFSFFNKTNIDLKSASKFSGAIENLEIKNIGTKSRHKALGIKLENLNQKLWLQKHDENYEKYLKQIKIGDFIKVYYLDNDIVQIEKESQIVFAKSEFESENKRRLWFVVIGVIIMIVLSIIHFTKIYKTSK